MANQGNDNERNNSWTSNSPCFRFGFGNETTVDEYIWRVATLLGDNMDNLRRIAYEQQRNVDRLVTDPTKHGRRMLEEALRDERMLEEELMNERVGYLCMVALCLLLSYV